MNRNAFVLWIMAGAGVFLVYAAIKNVSPTSLISSYATGKKANTTLVSTTTGTSAVSLASTPVVPDSSNLVVAPNGTTTTPVAYASTPGTYIAPSVSLI